MCGLVIDEWTERIPSRTEKAAITFHYSEPLSKAPQAILVASARMRVQGEGSTWDYLTLLQIVRDTFELTKARVTDPASVNSVVPGLSQFYIAQNTNNDEVSTIPAVDPTITFE